MPIIQNNDDYNPYDDEYVINDTVKYTSSSKPKIKSIIAPRSNTLLELNYKKSFNTSTEQQSVINNYKQNEYTIYNNKHKSKYKN